MSSISCFICFLNLVLVPYFDGHILHSSSYLQESAKKGTLLKTCLSENVFGLPSCLFDIWDGYRILSSNIFLSVFQRHFSLSLGCQCFSESRSFEYNLFLVFSFQNHLRVFICFLNVNSGETDQKVTRLFWWNVLFWQERKI